MFPRKFYPDGLAGEFALAMDMKNERQKRLNEKECDSQRDLGPGWTYNETLDRCLMPVGYANTGENVQDQIIEGVPEGTLPKPDELNTSPPEGAGDAAIQAEINNRKALKIQNMQGQSNSPKNMA